MNRIEYKKFSKGTVFIQANKKNQEEYFLVKGIVRSFLYNPKGDEVTISFFKDKSVLTPNLIRTSNDKSNLNFETLQESELAIIDSLKLHQLMLMNHEIRDFANKVLELELITKVQKEIGLTTLTAKERLQSFRTNYPNFENLIPHPAIASFLGITNTSFSRLRKELAQK